VGATAAVDTVDTVDTAGVVVDAVKLLACSDPFTEAAIATTVPSPGAGVAGTEATVTDPFNAVTAAPPPPDAADAFPAGAADCADDDVKFASALGATTTPPFGGSDPPAAFGVGPFSQASPSLGPDMDAR
jgi:hypothetical protein